MHCPFCKEEFRSHDELQLHCLVCTMALPEPRITESRSSRIKPSIDSVVVRFRWEILKPCFESEVYLISSLAGSITLHWKFDEGLYESDTIGVPVGEHICQLAVGGDVVPTERFEVNEDSDVIFVIVAEANYRYALFDESYGRGRINGGVIRSDDEPKEPVDTSVSEHHLHLDMESRDGDTSNEMSPLYRELLQHQLSHGEPSWVPGSGIQSPVMSDTDLSALAGQQEEEPSLLSSLPNQREEVLLRPVVQGRPIYLFGDSDGAVSLPDGGGIDEQSGNETEDSIARLSSCSPVSNSHSECDSQASRNSPVHSEGNSRDFAVVSPLVVEPTMPQSLPPVPGGLVEEERRMTVPLPSYPPSTPGRDHDLLQEPNHLPFLTDESPTEHIQSTFRVSPLGSVLDEVTVSVTTEAGVVGNGHVTTTSAQRDSPTGSVHSSSLFSSGLPSPIMSPRGRSQSDTGVPLVSRGNAPGSVNTYPVRPHSLGGSVPSAAGLLTTLENPTTGAQSSISPVERQSPTGSTSSTSVQPQGRTEIMNSGRQNADNKHLSTPVLAESAGLFVGQSSPETGHQGNEHAVQNPRLETSDMGNPTELPMDTASKQPTTPVSSHARSTTSTPPTLSTAESEHSRLSTNNSPRKETSNTRGLTGTSYRQGAVASPVVTLQNSQLHDHDSGNSTASVHSPRHTTSGAQSPSELLRETPLTLTPSTGARLHHHESDSVASIANSPQRRGAFRSGIPPETSAVRSHSDPSTESIGQTKTSSVHSRSELSSLSNKTGIPSRSSAFVAVTGDRDSSYPGSLPSEVEALRQERDSLVRELRQRAAHYEADLRRLRSSNEDLQQQLLSIETVATLTKQDDGKTLVLEQTVQDLNTILQEKDQQIAALRESIRELEETKRQLRDEQESLKTVNELRLEDINKINSDLQQELSDLRRRVVSTQAQRSRDEGKIFELQVSKNALEQHVKRLEEDNTNLRKQLKQAQQESGSVGVGTRISKAKSETDLSRKFEKYTTHDEHKYSRDLEPVAKAVSFSTRADTSSLGTTRYRSHAFALPSRVLMNGHSSYAKRPTLLSNSTSQDIVAQEPVSDKLTVPRHRRGSLGEDSDASDDLEHAPHPRWRQTQSTESSSSSVISWDHDYCAYSPVSSMYQPRDGSMGRRRRTHSYHGGFVHDLYSGKDHNSASEHVETSPYSQSLRDVGRRPLSSSSYCSNSSLPTSTSQQPSSAKLLTKPFAPTSSSDIQLGMEVLVTRSRGQIARGKVKYVGPLPGRHDAYIGIELAHGQEGKHDGTLNGQRLFTCKPNRGIFVSFNKVVMCYG